jgi:glyoxylase-like metal-dependent hydrolase (beta-lactamase superfamily II)
MVRKLLRRGIFALFLCSSLLATCALAQEVAPFSASQLVKLGDRIRYGVYTIRKIGEGIYQINNRDSAPPTGTPGALGVDMYLLCGQKKALLIDSGNNYITGYNDVPARKNGAEELRAIVNRLAGKLPLECTVTHMHQDHDGMTGAFLDRKVSFWAGEGEDREQMQRQFKLDPSVYTLFKHGQKSFDLGGGRIVETFLLRGHTNGGTVYLLKKDGMLITGDCFGNGEGLGMSSGERLKNFAEDTQKLADYIMANFSPYERYALKVYSGHSWENGYQGINNQEMEHVDVGYLDWRFLQNMLSCAKGIIKGQWLVEGSGLRFVEYSTDPKSGNYNRSAKPGERRGYMIYGIGSFMMSLPAAYEAAGLQMPR